MKIGNKIIDYNNPCFVIAEMSANHNGDFDTAVQTIIAAAKAGADAIKVQTYTADTLTIDCDNEYFTIIEGPWKGQTLYDLYKGASMPWEWQPKLKKIAEEEGLIFFSTPSDNIAVDFLEDMNVPVYKVASFEIHNIPLIKYIASKGKPIIFSAGIAHLEDLHNARRAVYNEGVNEMAFLKCTSAYPAPLKDMNLATIPHMIKEFEYDVIGLSDHTLGISAAIASVAIGAKIIEKHFILDRNMDSPDASFSMEPSEFKFMVESIREVEEAMGEVRFGPKYNKQFSRSLFVVENIKEGELFTKENIRSIRPGYGLHPKYYLDTLGVFASVNISKGSPLQWEHIVK